MTGRNSKCRGKNYDNYGDCKKSLMTLVESALALGNRCGAWRQGLRWGQWRLWGIVVVRGSDGVLGGSALAGCAAGFWGVGDFDGVSGFTDARHRRALTLRRPSGAWIWAKPAVALGNHCGAWNSRIAMTLVGSGRLLGIAGERGADGTQGLR
jgi:hypothetical protein